MFDLGVAHELYGTLLGPVEALIKGKPHLLVVPTGALTALPFHLLVTEKPAKPVPSSRTSRSTATPPGCSSAMRSASCLRREPESVAVLGRKDAGTRPMIGFGDPIFDPAERARARRSSAGHRPEPPRRPAPTPISGRAPASTAGGLRRRCRALLDTADELEAVAAKLGAQAQRHPSARRRRARPTVKRAALADYRVIYFATHGLIAGDVKGLAEPSLALTMPNEANRSRRRPPHRERDRATQAQCRLGRALRLQHDRRRPPGCGGAVGSRRAFFYAGARALLVSHWAVDSAAATRLTTRPSKPRERSQAWPRRGAAPRHASFMNDLRPPPTPIPRSGRPSSWWAKARRGDTPLVARCAQCCAQRWSGTRRNGCCNG